MVMKKTIVKIRMITARAPSNPTIIFVLRLMSAPGDSFTMSLSTHGEYSSGHCIQYMI